MTIYNDARDYPPDPSLPKLTRKERLRKQRQANGLNKLRWVEDREHAQALYELHKTVKGKRG